MSKLPASVDNSDLESLNGGSRSQQVWQLLCGLPVLASWAYGVWLYSRLPASVPVHFGFSGQPDRYGGPAEAAFLLPGLLTFMAVLLLFILPLSIPNTTGYAGTRRAYVQLIGIVLSFMSYLQVVISQMFMGKPVALFSLLTLGAGVMFVLLGNLLPKLRPNPIAGARLPWVMRDEALWSRTQRAAGWSFVLLGLALVCLSPLPGYLPLLALLVGKLLIVALVVWYSLRISRPSTA